MGIITGITCRYMGCEVHEFEEVDSTNARAIELAREGSPEGTVVIARVQTGGRGRMDRSWSSPMGGLYLSMVLRPGIDPSEITVLPLLAGLAVSKAISTSTGLVSSLKWPNDVLIDGKKVCGILTESSFKGEQLEYVVLGIGINVNVEIGSLPDDVSSRATSLMSETGREVDMSDVARDLMYMLDMLYGRFVEGQAEAILGEWTDRSSTIGHEVVVSTSSGPVEGKALGVDNTGALMVQQGRRLTRVDHGDCLNLK